MRSRSIATPTQNLASPRSFISQMEESSALKLEASKREETAMRKSSTCMPVRTEPDSVSRKYRQYSQLILVKPRSAIPAFIVLFQTRDPCGKPYKPLRSSQI